MTTTVRRLALALCVWLAASCVSAQTFTDDPLVQGVTAVRAIHITELRQSVNLLRVAAGLQAASWTDPTIIPGVTTVMAVHVLELRARLDEAITAAGQTPTAYTDPTLAGTPIKAVHIAELRARVRALAWLNGNRDILRSTSYDGDRKSDIAIYRPLDGTWYILTSQSNYTAQMSIAWGTSTDIPVPGDYDGDGRADAAYFRPSTGQWKILTSSSNFDPAACLTISLGVRGDVPVPGDYDGDGKTDAAVFHAATATWTILKSAGGTTNTVFGTWSSIPVPGDYDGDGKTDIATFDPAASPSWSIQNSSGGQSSASLGVAGDIPVPGDYDGDGRYDVAVFHPAATGQWQILKSSTNNSPITIPWGTTGDIPIVGDYDGDGIIDAVVFRPSTGQWLMALSSSNYTAGSSVTYGGTTDIPLGRATQRVQPVIASVSPNSEVIGNTVTLTGTRFGPAPGIITFNGAIAQPLTWSSTAITAPVPPGATTGPLVVTVNGIDSNTAGFTVLTSPGVTSTFCHVEWDTQLSPGQWWTHTWQAGDCTHGVPPAGWVAIGQAQNTDNPIAAVADCQAAYGQVYNNPDFTGATGTSLNCMYVAPSSQPQPTPGITICSHTWNEFVVGVWAMHTWAPSDCSHGLPESNDAWAGQSYFLPGMTDCSNGAPSYYNPYNWGNQTAMTVKCVYIRVASPPSPRFTLCTTGTLRNPDGSINYHSGWYNPTGTYQYDWKGTDCTNGLPQPGASGVGIAVGSATNGGGGLQGGNCLQGGAQHYNDPDWSGYTTGQMRCLFENNATSPYPISNPCGIGTFPHNVELSADGGRWYFLLNAFAGCGWTAVATVDWLLPDQSAGTGSGVLTFGVSPNNGTSSRTGGIQVCGTDPVLCGMFVVVQTPYWDGQPFCGGYCPGPGDTPPPTSAPSPVGTIVYYHTDAIGSVRMVTDAGQVVLARYDYWPFGEQQTGAPSSSGTDPRMFAGAERDSSTNTNFDYLGARYYAGLFGRFTTPDPLTVTNSRLLEPYRLNRYQYARNNPLSFVDPRGMDDFYYDQSGELIEDKTKKHGWLWNHTIGDTHTLVGDDGKSYSLESALHKLPNGERYSILSESETESVMSAFLRRPGNERGLNDGGLTSYTTVWSRSQQGGDWDFKSKPEARNRLFSLGDGTLYQGEYLGNVLWGQIMASRLFLPTTAIGGAAVQQVRDGRMSRCIDDCRDMRAILRGYWIGP